MYVLIYQDCLNEILLLSCNLMDWITCMEIIVHIDSLKTFQKCLLV